jgi:hypothetical protein
MWAILSDPGHAESFADLGEVYASLRRLVEQLGQRSYAGQIYAFKSMTSFNLTTAPSYQEAAGHDEIGIAYNPESGLFGIGFSEWVSPTRNPRHRTAASRACEVQGLPRSSTDTFCGCCCLGGHRPNQWLFCVDQN